MLETGLAVARVEAARVRRSVIEASIEMRRGESKEVFVVGSIGECY
jgi:hypothetical protein